MATAPRPLVHVEDVQIGAYLADEDGKQLYTVVDVRTIEREGHRVRVAMLENAATDTIDPWDFADLSGLRVVKANG